MFGLCVYVSDCTAVTVSTIDVSVRHCGDVLGQTGTVQPMVTHSCAKVVIFICLWKRARAKIWGCGCCLCVACGGEGREAGNG